jgi:hypothetical protein
LKLDQWLAKKVIARSANPKDFEQLRKLPKARVEVLYKEGDGEAYWYAESIRQALSAIGWDVPTQVVATRGNPNPEANGAPLIGTYVVVRAKPDPKDLFPPGRLGSLMFTVGAQFLEGDSTLPENTFRIVVGEYLRSWVP